MLLIGQFDSPFVRRVALAMHHYAVPFEHRPWSVWADADAIAGYNPLRRVPVLVLDGGEVLVESASILDALDEDAPDERRLVPRSGAERRAILRACALVTGVADKAVSLFYEGALRKEDHRSRVWTERCLAQIRDTLDLLERERAGSGGDTWFGRLTHADIALGCMLRFAREATPSVFADRPRPALFAHAERCEASPLFESAVQPFHVAL